MQPCSSSRPSTVGTDFALEVSQPAAAAAGRGVRDRADVDPPGRPARPWSWSRQWFYSVPAGLIGRRVRVVPRPDEILAFDGARS